jgi:hypothetical protein
MGIMTTTEASKPIPRRNSNKTLRNTMTTPSTRNSALKDVTVAGIGWSRVELSLGAE